MNIPQVINRHYDKDPNAIYIGRPSKWGNPFKITPMITRDQACDAFAYWFDHSLEGQKLQQHLPELKGKNLSCFCAPMRCHGDFLMARANI